MMHRTDVNISFYNTQTIIIKGLKWFDESIQGIFVDR